MPKPRVILDRSALHGESFDQLVKSPLLSLSRARFISVYHTASFIEETASLYMNERNHEIFQKQLPFILDICNERWLQPTETIWTKELVERVDQKEVVFVPSSERQEMELVLRKLSEGVFQEDDLKGARLDKDDAKQKSDRLHATSVQMRETVAEKRSKLPNNLKNKPSFHSFVEQHLDDFGCGILKRHLKVHPDSVDEICQRWSHNKTRYPFVTSFMKGMLYSAYYAMTEPNQKIDVNAQMDIEQLSYLVGVDILVSNERKFMRAAFDALWRAEGKRYMSTDEFISFLNSLAAN